MNVREMYNYGYKWTGMIPLTAEEARNLFLNDSIQIYRLYQDNTCLLYTSPRPRD